MTGDNSTAQKYARTYDRLLCAIIENKPKAIIDGFLFEFIACDYKYRELITQTTTHEEYEKAVLDLAKIDAKNYYSHRQGGRSTLVLKTSPLGRKLAKGAFAENEEA